MAVARLPAGNSGAQLFFESAGFGDAHTSEALEQTELRRRIGLRGESPAARWPAYYINMYIPMA